MAFSISIMDRLFPEARARAAWRACLAAALRTSVACLIVALTSLYGPTPVRALAGFPAFSYVTVVLVVTDASLGDGVRATWLALYATVQSLGPAALSLWLIGPERMTRGVVALEVALGAFVVALLESTHILAKRIALGQIVLVYVIAFIHGGTTEPIMHTVRVGVSTAVGIFACVLALLLPFPRLACREVKHNCHQFAENASQRLKSLVTAFCARDNASSLESTTQAKNLALIGSKLVQTVKRFQGSMQWEIPRLKCLKRRYISNPAERMQELEVPLRGLEIALTNIPSFPTSMVSNEEPDTELKTGLLRLVDNNMVNLGSGILQNDTIISADPDSTELENPAFQQKIPNQIPEIATHDKDSFVPSLFFLFCMKLALHVTKTTPMKKTQTQKQHPTSKKDNSENSFTLKAYLLTYTYDTQRLVYAFKCSLSLGLAVFFGLTYSKPDGYWAGLPVAISLAAGRDATFRLANLKTQGTVLGTVYGVLVWFIFGKSLPMRLFSLLPWLVFTSFLQRSKMYGQAGAISAVIGAILVLGRKGFGEPSEFAVARIVETFIGLSCSIMIDIIFQPVRASTLSKTHLSRSLDALYHCVNALTLCEKDKAEFEEERKRLRMCVNDLGKFVGEAKLEPNFWFLPFASESYGKLLKSLTMTVDLLEFIVRSLRFLREDHESLLVDGHDGLEGFKELVCSSVKCVGEISLVKSLAVLEEEVEKSNDKSNTNSKNDIEMSKTTGIFSSLNDNEINKVMGSYLQRSREMIEKIDDDRDGDDDYQEEKRHAVLGLSALGFCLHGLIRETKKIEVAIKEVVQWENPSSRVNLNEISCMINSLKI